MKYSSYVAALVFSLLAFFAGATVVSAQVPSYTIEASKSTYALGEVIEVAWEREGRTSSSRDWIGLFHAGDDNTEFIAWRYLPLTQTTSGTVTFTEVAGVGAYEVRVFLRNEFTAGGSSDFFTVIDSGTNDPFAIDVVDRSISRGDDVEADWTAPRNRSSSQDWIGLFREGASNNRYLDYEYIADGATAGSVSFNIDDNGQYRLRMFINNSFTKVAESQLIQVGPRTQDDEEYSLEIQDTEIVLGEKAVVEWTAPIDRSRRDWIGLFEDGASDEDYLQYHYLGSRYTEGEVEFTIEEPGEYEFRLFEDNTFEKILEADDELRVVNPQGDDAIYRLERRTDPVIVGQTMRIGWEKPASRTTNRDWIGLFSSGAADTDYISYHYLPARTGSGEVSIPLPTTPGQYEVRMFINNTFTRVAQLSSFSVITDPSRSEYELTLEQTEDLADRVFSVRWEIPEGEGLARDWIGLYREGAADRSYQAYQYTNGAATGVAEFRISTPGRYVFRYLKNNQFDRVTESPVFTVLDPAEFGYVCRGGNLALVTNYPTNDGPIIAFGDSLTAGVGATIGEDYVSELERRLGMTIDNQGVSGNTTVDALARLEADVLSKNPSTVLVWLGGNDEIRRLYERIRDRALERNRVEQLDAIATSLGYDWMSRALMTRDETFLNLTEIVTRIQDSGAEVIVIGLDADLLFNDFKNGYRDVAAETGSWYVEDVLDGVLTRSSLRSDIVHPNDAGYDIVADRIEPGLSCLLTTPSR